MQGLGGYSVHVGAAGAASAPLIVGLPQPLPDSSARWPTSLSRTW
jgi:hypothetical protein